MRGLMLLALRSAWYRRFGSTVVVLSIALSTLVLVLAERVRADLRSNFGRAVAGIDLIVGARGSGTQLLLSSVFRIGQVQQGMLLTSVEAVRSDRAVSWVVPIALGDSHRGYPVVGTTAEYFSRLRSGGSASDGGPRAAGLALAQGRVFGQGLEAVVGSEMARRLGLALEQSLVLSHGDGVLASADHAQHPVRVVGILAPTGTPVDRSLHVSLETLDSLHQGWMGMGMGPQTVNAALVGLKSRGAVFSAQRRIQEFEEEALSAILPGVALDELWSLVGMAEQALLAMGVLVATVSVAGLMAVVVGSLEQRRRELAILRSVGAGPARLFALLLMESLLLGAMGALIGLGVALGATAVGAAWVQDLWGFALSVAGPTPEQLRWVALVLAASAAAGLLPGWRAYRQSLSDGLSPRGN